MHLFLFDSKDNLIGTLNDGIEKQNKDKTGNVLDEITSAANDRIAKTTFGNLNIEAIDKVTTKLPKVETVKKEDSEEDLGEKKSIEEILNEATKKTQEASASDIKEGVKGMTDSISQIGENIQKVGDTIDSLGTGLGDLIN
ncbi:MAG: hypothetical protein MJ246_06100 [Clostridia bacterium]|nr:hypothetical protein [Clostridia bacterium]